MKNYLEFIKENSNQYCVGDVVLIRYWETGDICPVKIIKKLNNSYEITFQTGLGEYQNAPNQVIKQYDIIGIQKSIAEPALNTLDIKKQYNDISNDLVINNYPKTI